MRSYRLVLIAVLAALTLPAGSLRGQFGSNHPALVLDVGGHTAPVSQVLFTRNSKELIIGRPADAQERATIERTVESQPEVESLRQLRTVHLGPDHLFVALNLQFKSDITAAQIERGTRRMQRELRDAVPDIGDVLFDLVGNAEHPRRIDRT